MMNDMPLFGSNDIYIYIYIELRVQRLNLMDIRTNEART